jgi:hypothetical protein
MPAMLVKSSCAPRREGATLTTCSLINNQVIQVNGHGGRREGAGRKPGAFNRIAADIRALAEPFGAAAVAELARLAGLTKAPGALNEATRVAALRELLDRGYGRATTILAGDSEAPPAVIRFEWASAAPPAADVAATVIDAVTDDTHSSAPLTLAWQSDC